MQRSVFSFPVAIMGAQEGSASPAMRPLAVGVAMLITSVVATALLGIMKNMLKKYRKNLQVSDKTTTFAHAFEKQCLAIRAIPLEGWVSG